MCEIFGRWDDPKYSSEPMSVFKFWSVITLGTLIGSILGSCAFDYYLRR